MWKHAGGFVSSAAAELIPAATEVRPDSPEYILGQAPHHVRGESPDLLFRVDHVTSGRVSTTDSADFLEPRGHPEGVTYAPSNHSLPVSYGASPDAYDYLRMQAMAARSKPVHPSMPAPRNSKRPFEDVTVSEFQQQQQQQQHHY